jgi:hypothetical protein
MPVRLDQWNVTAGQEADRNTLLTTVGRNTTLLTTVGALARALRYRERNGAPRTNFPVWHDPEILLIHVAHVF